LALRSLRSFLAKNRAPEWDHLGTNLPALVAGAAYTE